MAGTVGIIVRTGSNKTPAEKSNLLVLGCLPKKYE
jgi:hypothetical protein